MRKEQTWLTSTNHALHCPFQLRWAETRQGRMPIGMSTSFLSARLVDHVHADGLPIVFLYDPRPSLCHGLWMFLALSHLLNTRINTRSIYVHTWSWEVGQVVAFKKMCTVFKNQSKGIKPCYATSQTYSSFYVETCYFIYKVYSQHASGNRSSILVCRCRCTRRYLASSFPTATAHCKSVAIFLAHASELLLVHWLIQLALERHTTFQNT